MSRPKSLLALLLILVVLTACGAHAQEQQALVDLPAMEETQVPDISAPEEPKKEQFIVENPESELASAPETEMESEFVPATETTSRPNPSGVPQAEKIYYIKINCQANTVTVYTKDETGAYTVPYKAMVCSTGTATPQSGVYRIGYKWEWLNLFGDVFGYYVTQINGNILFHSVPYVEKYNPASLEYWEFDKLGTNASMGCIRLQLKDAIWVYNNAEAIAAVEFYNAEDPGPLGKPTAPLISESEQCRNWDPTDPNPENPWHAYYEGNPPTGEIDPKTGLPVEPDTKMDLEEQEMVGPEAEFVDPNDAAAVPGETPPAEQAPSDSAPPTAEGEPASGQEGAEELAPGESGAGTDGAGQNPESVSAGENPVHE